MISEESCDTEDWSNDAENTAAHHSNQLHFKYNPKSEKGWDSMENANKKRK